MTDPIRVMADEALTFHRLCFELLLDGQRGFQKQVDTAFETSRELLALQRDQQAAWAKVLLDGAARPPAAS